MISSLVSAVLDWLKNSLIQLATWIFGLLSKAIDQYKQRKQIDEKSKQSVEPLKNAQTKEEIEKASDSALNGF